MNKKVIIFNGPPRSGKDTFGEMIHSDFEGSKLHSFKKPLKELAAVITRKPDLWFTSDYEELKETKLPVCFDMTPRELLIKISEDVIKPHFGDDFFGVCAAKDLVNGINIFTDGGFQKELEPLINAVGAENVFVFRLHRKGCDFSGDSRSYLSKKDNPGVTFFDVENDDIKKAFREIWSFTRNVVTPADSKGLNS